MVLCIGVRPKNRRPNFDAAEFLPSKPNRNLKSLSNQAQLFNVIIDLAADDFKFRRQHRVLEFKTTDEATIFMYVDPEKQLDLHESFNRYLKESGVTAVKSV